MFSQLRPPLLARFVIYLSGCLVSIPALAQEAVRPAPQLVQEPVQAVPRAKPVELTEADAESFVVGDWYKLRVKRRDVSAPFEGTLVKVTDQWIVLRLIRESRNDFAVPVVSKLPLVGKRLFSNVGIGRTDETLWIPRDAATVEQRTLFAGKPATVEEVAQASTFGVEDQKTALIATRAGLEMQAPAGEEPPAGRACALDLAGAKEMRQAKGDVIAVTDDVVSLMVAEAAVERVMVPVLGDVPMVGKAFSRTRVVNHPARRQFDRADLLCVRISNHQQPATTVELVPAPPEEATPVAPAPPPAPK